jgi:EAL domain-containing protein (putative c-di-GMP-specific phosphodiesterase class I)
MQSGAIAELEALVRWRHPERGFVSPGDFIPLAEETGLIVPLGAWVLRRACRQLQEWREGGGPEVPVAVNVSPRQFAQATLVDETIAVLRETGVSPRSIKLEITESALMSRAPETLAIMARLRELGVAFYLDDFGTGYSSLGYLPRMPIAALKIDRSFVSSMGADPTARSIVEIVVTLAHGMGMHVVAEGVETKEQLEQLRALRCDYAQGFFLARPMDAAQVARLFGAAPVRQADPAIPPVS